jgi:hypothetical protein
MDSIVMSVFSRQMGMAADFFKEILQPQTSFFVKKCLKGRGNPKLIFPESGFRKEIRIFFGIFFSQGLDFRNTRAYLCTRFEKGMIS